MTQHPIQPLEERNGVLRFKKNGIVRFLLDAGQIGLNRLAEIPFSDEDREQFAQLIGYSLSGFGELDYVSDETYEQADKAYKQAREQERTEGYGGMSISEIHKLIDKSGEAIAKMTDVEITAKMKLILDDMIAGKENENDPIS